VPIIRINDADLFYEEAGTGEPLLLLHGLGSSTLDWEPQIKAFAPYFRVIAIDTRGSGKSRDAAHPAGPFSVKQFAADTAAVLDKLGASPAHVVGLSMGGMIAFQFATDFPASVRTLTIINSGPQLIPRTFKEHMGLAVRKFISRFFGPKAIAGILAPKLFPRPDQEALRRQFIERLAMNDKDAYLATLKALIGWSVIDRIGTIKVPTLIIHAERDYTPLAAKEAYAKLLPDAQLVVVEGAGHALPIEDPQKVFPVLHEFLERHTRRSSAAGVTP
jgi:pimeloyl-ACP methyl ester carboxylesterase